MSDTPGLLEAVLAATHLVVPDRLPGLIRRHAEKLGATEATLHVVDLDQTCLVPLPEEGRVADDAVAIEGTLAGRAYRQMQIVVARVEGHAEMWVPVVDGTARLGVLLYVFPDAVEPDVDAVKALTGLVAELVMTKSDYGDFLHRARRRRPLSLSAELLWQLLPPLTFGTDELVIAGVLVPTSELGGDAFDYGVDLEHAQVAIFDAMGHGLHAGLLATTAVAAYRNGRRKGMGLADIAVHIGSAIEAHFDSERFVTGIVATLIIATGELTLVNAGHHAPLLIRRGHIVKQLHADGGQPFGMGGASSTMTESLEPGDRVLFFTDGVTEARSVDGDFFDLDRLAALIGRTGNEYPPPEAMRRLMHAIEDHNDGPMRDDATLLMLEWQGAGSAQLEVGS